MMSTIPSNTIPPLTLISNAMTVTLSPPLVHFLTEMTIAVNSITESQKSAVFSILTLSSLQTCAAHAMVERLYPREKLATTVKTGMK